MTDFSHIGVVFATPSTQAQVCNEGFLAALGADRILIKNGIQPDYLGASQDPYLSKVRSKLATIFLEEFTNATHLFFVDDDVGFQPEKPLEYIRAGFDVVAGIYPKKSDVLSLPITLVGDPPFNWKRNYIEAMMVPTGFMCIARHVIEKVAEASGVFVDNDIMAGPGTKRRYKEIFKMGRGANELWYGEDVLFCAEVRQLGFTVWADTDHVMSHRGAKAWASSLGMHLPTEVTDAGGDGQNNDQA